MTKETVQVIAWTIEVIGFVATLVGGRYLWKFAKRASFSRLGVQTNFAVHRLAANGRDARRP